MLTENIHQVAFCKLEFAILVVSTALDWSTAIKPMKPIKANARRINKNFIVLPPDV